MSLTEHMGWSLMPSRSHQRMSPHCIISPQHNLGPPVTHCPREHVYQEIQFKLVKTPCDCALCGAVFAQTRRSHFFKSRDIPSSLLP